MKVLVLVCLLFVNCVYAGKVIDNLNNAADSQKNVILREEEDRFRIVKKSNGEEIKIQTSTKKKYEYYTEDGIDYVNVYIPNKDGVYTEKKEFHALSKQEIEDKKIYLSKQKEIEILGKIDLDKLHNSDESFKKDYYLKNGKDYNKEGAEDARKFTASITPGDISNPIFANITIPTNDPDRKIYGTLGNGAIDDAYKQKNFKDSIDGVAKSIVKNETFNEKFRESYKINKDEVVVFKEANISKDRNPKFIYSVTDKDGKNGRDVVVTTEWHHSPNNVGTVSLIPTVIHRKFRSDLHIDGKGGHNLYDINSNNKMNTVEASNVDKKNAPTNVSINTKSGLVESAESVGKSLSKIAPIFSLYQSADSYNNSNKTAIDKATLVKDVVVEGMSLIPVAGTIVSTVDIATDLAVMATNKTIDGNRDKSVAQADKFRKYKTVLENHLRSEVQRLTKLKGSPLTTEELKEIQKITGKSILTQLSGTKVENHWFDGDVAKNNYDELIQFAKDLEVGKRSDLMAIQSNSYLQKQANKTIESNQNNGTTNKAAPIQMITNQPILQQFNTNNSLPSSNSLNNGNGAVVSHSGSVTAIGITGTDAVNKAQNGAKSQFTLGTNTNTISNKDITAIGITGGSAVNDADGNESEAKLRIGNNGR